MLHSVWSLHSIYESVCQTVAVAGFLSEPFQHVKWQIWSENTAELIMKLCFYLFVMWQKIPTLDLRLVSRFWIFLENLEIFLVAHTLSKLMTFLSSPFQHYFLFAGGLICFMITTIIRENGLMCFGELWRKLSSAFYLCVCDAWVRGSYLGTTSHQEVGWGWQ